MKPFQFKEFTVCQDKTAMKIGTDAVLLGAWSALGVYPNTILDIGSGTGIIALMLAQRSDAMCVDAIEIDESAYEQSVENFESSPWSDRLFCYHASLRDFVKEMAEDEEAYDVIVSNPPFFTETYETEDIVRNKARFTSSLSFEDLLLGVSKLLSKNGCFSVVIPFKEEQLFIEIARQNKLFPQKICRVRGNMQSEIKRSLLSFSFHKAEPEYENLIIEIERHQYTEAYINLTKDFYLKM